MAEVIALPDVEALVKDYLRAQYAGRNITARVGTKVPTTRPDQMVRISHIDTIQQTLKDFYARVLFECWDPDETVASLLARTTFGLVYALRDGHGGTNWVSDVVPVSGVVNFPDPSVGPRYQFTADLLVAGEVI